MLFDYTLHVQSNLSMDAVTSTKQSPVLKGHLLSCPIIENFKTPLFLKDKKWPLNTGLNVLASVQAPHITSDILTVILRYNC